jgi:L-methionine (R)-S-oxide reductase
MPSGLKTYIDQLLQDKIKNLELTNLEFNSTLKDRSSKVDSEHFAVTFLKKNFGFLLSNDSLTTSKKNELTDFAAQLGCLLNFENPEIAIALDQYISELSKTHQERYHWSGIYLLDSQNMLNVASFRGEVTPHLVIPIDRGICGAAVREEKTINIPDVSADDRYLSCSIKTRSEIVVPIFSHDGLKVIGEIDIDSHLPNAFTVDDELALQRDAKILTQLIKN